jgi:hypothetical protein
MNASPYQMNLHQGLSGIKGQDVILKQTGDGE